MSSIGENETIRAASELRVVVGRLVRRLRAEGVLPLPQATVLGRLERDGPQTTSDLAAAEGVRPQSMAATVAELERAELIVRRADPADGRKLLIDLTPKALDVLEEERRTRVGWLADALATLDAEDQLALVRAVEPLRRLGDA